MLVRLGLIDASDLRAVLAPQADFRLGRLLVDCGAVDESALQRALEHSRKTGHRLGESLVEAGLASAELVDAMLARQRRLTRLALVVSALSALSPAPAVAGDTVRVQVVATVLARASLDTRRMPQEVTVSADDVARGYVEPPAPVEIAVQTNHPNGVLVRFAGNGAQIAAVEVDGAGTVVRVAAEGRGMQKRELRVRLRLHLAPGTVAGKIAFPVSVSMTPA